MKRVAHRAGIYLALWIALSLWACVIDGCYTIREAELPDAIVEVLRGTVVDLNPDAGSVMVKVDETYETWRVAVVRSTWIRTRDGRDLDLADLRLGERIEIHGTTRLDGLITAYGINSLEDRPEEEDNGRSK